MTGMGDNQQQLLNLTPSAAAASRMVADYINTLQPAEPCPRCGGSRGKDTRWDHVLHVDTIRQVCP